jgi:hypothetical protein
VCKTAFFFRGENFIITYDYFNIIIEKEDEEYYCINFNFNFKFNYDFNFKFIEHLFKEFKADS